MSVATDFPQKAVETCHSSTAQAIQQWLHESAGGERRLDYAVSALEWCRRLPELADMLPAAVWQRLLHHLLQTAAEAGTEDAAASLLASDPVAHQLLAGELALTLATFFPEIKACRRVLPRARRALSAGLADLLDGEGLPQARHFDRVRPLLACWTRCRALGNHWRRGSWSAEADVRYRKFVRNALRLARRDGSPVFSEEPADREDAATLTAAVAMVGGLVDRDVATIVLSDGRKHCRKRADAKLPEPAIHSEWAATAVMRSDWSRSAPRLTVLYPDATCRVELACGKDVLWSGRWGFDVRIDGVSVSPVSEWSSTCWVSDEDVDYLELEIELNDGLRLQRHIVLARKDGFLLMADAVLGSRLAALNYRGSLPLNRGIEFRAAGESNEGMLAGRKARAVAIPLALPEWRPNGVQSSPQNPPGVPLPGTSSAISMVPARQCLFQAVARGDDEDVLELQQSTLGRSLFAPLLFDLDRRRFGKPLTWRQLTVAESMAVQPDDVAVGYRISAGGKQWLIYRSLAPPRNRTLLGHNLSSETLVARFSRKGEITSLIEIET
jgi:hypothetical protein